MALRNRELHVRNDDDDDCLAILATAVINTCSLPGLLVYI